MWERRTKRWSHELTQVLVATALAATASTCASLGLQCFGTFAPMETLHRCPQVGWSTGRHLRDASMQAVRQAAPKLPKGQHKPKQSLGQSYLTDANYIKKIADRFEVLVPAEERGQRVVEFASGLGAITRPLAQRFPEMSAVEIDARAVAVLNRDLPRLNLLHADILELDFASMAQRHGRLRLVGNLPYSVGTNILFKVAEQPDAVELGFFMVQKEVAQKIVAEPGSKDYCPLAVMLQLSARTKMSFNVPPAAFYPKPKVTSAMVELHFDKPASVSGTSVDLSRLREVLTVSFQQRKKGLRHSLRSLVESQRCGLPSHFEKMRAEQLNPSEFVELTRFIFPRAAHANQHAAAR